MLAGVEYEVTAGVGGEARKDMGEAKRNMAEGRKMKAGAGFESLSTHTGCDGEAVGGV